MATKNTKLDNPGNEEILHTKLEAMAERVTKHHDLPIEETKHKHRHAYITQHIKQERYNETLQHTQNELPPTDKHLSKVLHAPFIYEIGELLSHTLFRPITLLICSIATLVVGFTLLLWTRRMGIDYPNTLFIVVFLLAYPFSIAIDLLISFFKSRKVKSNKI